MQSRFDISLNVQGHSEAKNQEISVISSTSGYKVALPEQAKKETEQKQSMAAQLNESQPNQKNSCVSTAVWNMLRLALPVGLQGHVIHRYIQVP